MTQQQRPSETSEETIPRARELSSDFSTPGEWIRAINRAARNDPARLDRAAQIMGATYRRSQSTSK